MLRSGNIRQRLAGILNAAYGEGLLSEATLAHRLELLFDSRLIDPARVTGDLTLRTPRRALADLLLRVRALADRRPSREWSCVLALDWAGGQEDLLVGREADCDVVLTDPTVSRRHAGLRFRDGHWILRDLGSRNGTLVNDARVIRCQLHPGDRLRLGDQWLLID